MLTATFAILTAQVAAPAPDLHVGLIGPGIEVADVERAIRFYRNGLGLQVVRRMPMQGGEEVMLAFGDATTPLLILVRHNGRRAAAAAVVRPGPAGKIILSVADADIAVRRLRQSGYRPEPVHRDAAHGVATFWISDPDGHRLEIVARSGASR